ncbi:MAG TPA: hypothetical protein VLH58_03060, partial [Candidatus Methylomirabilis sp.]|nr:hypothetical protein [Candidatus Methylomirabilis sp.]
TLRPCVIPILPLDGSVFPAMRADRAATAPRSPRLSRPWRNTMRLAEALSQRKALTERLDRVAKVQ